MTPCGDCGGIVPVERYAVGRGAGVEIVRRIGGHVRKGGLTLCAASGKKVLEDGMAEMGVSKCGACGAPSSSWWEDFGAGCGVCGATGFEKRDRVVDLERKVLEVVGDWSPNARPEDRLDEDLGFDSLDFVEMVMYLESDFNIRVPQEEVEKIKTVGDAIDCVRRNVTCGAR